MTSFVDSIVALISLLALTLAGFGYALRERGKRKEAEKDKEQETIRAEGEKYAREKNQETADRARKVDDAVERTPADERRERLRKYSTGDDSTN